MKLSIVIVSYNTKKLTTDCIGSIFKHAPKASFEVIVVDNNSTDGSVDEIENKFKSRVALIKNNENLGFSKANNMGIRISKGEHVLLLNSDTKIIDGSLQKLIDMADGSDYSIMGACLLNPDGSVQPSCFNIPTIGRAVKHYLLRIKMLDKFAPKEVGLSEVESVVGAAMLIRRKLIDKIGALDEKFFFYYEDLEYCRRAKRLNYKVYYNSEVRIVHLHGASAKGKTNKFLIESSKKFHGPVEHFVINFIIKLSQLINKLI